MAKDDKAPGATTGGTSKKHPKPTAAKSGTAPAAKASRKPVRLDSPRWLAPLMIVLFVIGLVWIVAYYIAPDAPLIASLSFWNVVIGFGFLTAGFIVATKWR